VWREYVRRITEMIPDAEEEARRARERRGVRQGGCSDDDVEVRDGPADCQQLRFGLAELFCAFSVEGNKIHLLQQNPHALAIRRGPRRPSSTKEQLSGRSCAHR
jgi:hypothetical protein